MAIGVVVALCCGGGVVGVVAAGHQAGPRRVFSRAIAAIFPTQNEQTSNTDPFFTSLQQAYKRRSRVDY